MTDVSITLRAFTPVSIKGIAEYLGSTIEISANVSAFTWQKALAALYKHGYKTCKQFNDGSDFESFSITMTAPELGCEYYIDATGVRTGNYEYIANFDFEQSATYRANAAIKAISNDIAKSF